MKWKTLLQAISILAFLSSCQSEYERQIVCAKKLVKKERGLLNEMGEMETITHNYTALESIQKELSFRAKLSGNEELFNEQIAAYRTDCELHADREQKLISKYP